MPSLPPIRPEDEAVALKTRPTGAFDAPVDEAHGRTLFELALRLGDDSLILSQRLSEWCGHAPSVEVDLSLANMALDLIGPGDPLPHPGCGSRRQGPQRR
jgi:ring-1,2-phenylacetyl-CoA epoxidase subunit PaaC